MDKGKRRRGQFVKVGVVLIGCAIFVLVATVVLVSLSPATGASGADFLRNILGPKPVAMLESLVFTAQDSIQQLKYKIHPSTPSAPWEAPTLQVNPTQPANTGVEIVLSLPQSLSTESSTDTNSPKSTPEPLSISLSNPTPAPLETLPATSQPYWPPSAVQALGTTPGEGVWTPYIQEKSGATVAYRTFLQPDPQRLYALVGIVAFDLARTRLHYQLGRVEPFVPGIPPGSGEIPPPDIQDGALLAAFNGGFKAVNGHFGVYFNGETILPPLDKMGTVAIYSDGHIQIGEWGTDLSLTPDIIIYRQNCPLMVHKGEINPLVYNNSVNDWGGTLKGNVETLRSGIGISQDGRVLYYFAGNNLNMPSLAQSMLIAGAYQAMQLDINNYWVIYTRFTYQGNQILTDSLLPKYMYDKVDRFLYPYARDFFYLTSVTHDGSD